MPGEFDIIRRYFNRPGLAADKHEHIPLGIGDDCALLTVPPGKQLACSMDTLTAGVHFPIGADSALVGYRALAVNLSDLAAMGAKPVGFTLALTLPEDDESWIAGFADGLQAAAARFHCPLFGGDLTRGPLSITIQVHGLVDAGRALTRHGAAVGDKVYVSGNLGAAGLALRCLDGDKCVIPDAHCRILLAHYWSPEPRLELAARLAGVASAGIDISDGLLADLGHLCARSHTGARIEAGSLPVLPLVRELSGEDAIGLALHAGDDYELVFTVAPANEAQVLAIGSALDIPLTRIGEMTAGPEVHCVDRHGNPLAVTAKGYLHFQDHD